MTKEELDNWHSFNQKQQISLFKAARVQLRLNQTELGDKLKDYGFNGGKKTVEAWEQGRAKIPVLVYELLVHKFRQRQ